MKFNPDISPKIWIPVLFLVLAYGFYMQGDPARSLARSREWMNIHREEWNQLKNTNPALKYVELGITTEHRGAVRASGFTFDSMCMLEVERFVKSNKPPNKNFKNRIRLLSKAEFDVWVEIAEEDKNEELPKCDM